MVHKTLLVSPSTKSASGFSVDNTSYDFAITLQEVVREVILLEQDIKKPEEKVFNAEVFVLYYFHRRQLEELAIKEFWTDLQIGRTLAAFVQTNHLNEG